MDLLIEKGLIEVIPHRKRASFRTSPTGKETLKKIKEILGLFGSRTGD
jgi:DNA-binding PadR family transcriptional regulator